MVLLPAEYQANDLTILLYVRYINLSLQIDETRQKAVDMMTDVRDITAKQTPAYDPAALNTAAFVGQVQVVKQLLELPEVDMNFRDPQYNYETALHGACRNGHFDIVKLLVAQKASVDIVDEYGWTPFHEALGANDLNLVEFMDQNGADMNKITGAGQTSLHFAARGNNVPILQYLLHSPLMIHSLSERDENGATPLLDGRSWLSGYGTISPPKIELSRDLREDQKWPHLSSLRGRVQEFQNDLAVSGFWYLTS
jgi:ankyrin repeat protein